MTTDRTRGSSTTWQANLHITVSSGVCVIVRSTPATRSLRASGGVEADDDRPPPFAVPAPALAPVSILVVSRGQRSIGTPEPAVDRRNRWCHAHLDGWIQEATGSSLGNLPRDHPDPDELASVSAAHDPATERPARGRVRRRLEVEPGPHPSWRRPHVVPSIRIARSRPDGRCVPRHAGWTTPRIQAVALGEPLTRRCGGHRIGGGRIEGLRCEILVNCCTAPGVLRWSMPRKALAPNKQIRWRIHTHYPGDTDDRQDDSAPDIGWYP